MEAIRLTEAVFWGKEGYRTGKPCWTRLLWALNDIQSEASKGFNIGKKYDEYMVFGDFNIFRSIRAGKIFSSFSVTQLGVSETMSITKNAKVYFLYTEVHACNQRKKEF